MRLSFVALCLSLLVVVGSSFVIPGGQAKQQMLAPPGIIGPPQILFSTDPEMTENNSEPSEGVQQTDVNAVSTTDTSMSAPTEESSPYPIDLPSPLLLASSMILTIAGVGKSIPSLPKLLMAVWWTVWVKLQNLWRFRSCFVFAGSIFDLTGGSEPNLGFGTTAAIAAVSIPVGLFLFYASILKATAETEEDDRDYLRK